MKIVSYAKWQWNKIDLWFKLYAANLILFLIGILTEHPFNILFLSWFMINLVFFVGVLIRDHFKESYHQFEKDQNQLLKIIKDSDKK